MEILLMCSLLCSSDVIAAVSLIKPKEQPKLFSLVFGEGIVNDAVSIILFNTVVKQAKGDTEFTSASAAKIGGDFLLLGKTKVWTVSSAHFPAPRRGRELSRGRSADAPARGCRDAAADDPRPSRGDGRTSLPRAIRRRRRVGDARRAGPPARAAFAGERARHSRPPARGTRVGPRFWAPSSPSRAGRARGREALRSTRWYCFRRPCGWATTVSSPARHASTTRCRS